jgi:hypothetical protein
LTVLQALGQGVRQARGADGVAADWYLPEPSLPVGAAVGCAPNIRFIDTPADLRPQYQYFTRANITKLRHAGFDAPFCSLEDGVRDYLARVSP